MHPRAFAIGMAAGAALALAAIPGADRHAMASVAVAAARPTASPFVRTAPPEARPSPAPPSRAARAPCPVPHAPCPAPLAPCPVPLAPSSSSFSSTSSPTPTFAWPVHGPVSSCYGERWGRIHVGLDIAAGDGTTVLAARSGRVVYSGSLPGYGNLILIDHFDGWYTVYGHNQRHLVEATRDGRSLVSAGQPIALVGRTGNATGPHCHFEIRKGIDAQDPLPILARATTK